MATGFSSEGMVSCFVDDVVGKKLREKPTKNSKVAHL